RRVAGRVPHVEANAARVERVAVVEDCGAVARGESILPVAPAFGGEEQRHASAPGEIAASRYEIGVDVRFGHVRDAEPLRRRRGQVLRDVTVRVDDDGFAAPVAADLVARLCEAFIVETPEEHRSIAPE